MWVRFLSRFEHRPHPRQVVIYKPGNRCNVTRKCGEAAVKAGKAESIPAPTRDEARQWQQAR